ncbi:MAG: DUF3592 domain-containing protein [Bryobacteraceae bacterium]
MPRQNAAARGSGGLFWRVWEKSWQLFAVIFIAVNVWASHRLGAVALLRFWAAFFAVLGALLLVHARRARRLAEESLQWPTVRATVLRSEVVHEEQTALDSEPQSTGHTMHFYYPEIEYEYEADGRRWRSHRLLTVRVNFPKAEAEAWIARYPAGSIVTARRHPRKPGLAILEPGLHGLETRYRIPFLVGGVFFVAGAAGWAVLSRWPG